MTAARGPGGNSPLGRYLAARLPFACVLLLSCSALAWLGASHWIAELFSHFVPHYAAGAVTLAVALTALRKYRWAGLCALIAAIHASSLVSWREALGSESDTDSIELVQYNVKYDHPDPRRITAWLRHVGADVVVLVEVGPHWITTLEELRDIYPHQAVHASASPFGVALLTRLAPQSLSIEAQPGDSYPHARLDLSPVRSGSPIRVLGIHPPPPVSLELAAARDAQLRRLGHAAAQDGARITVIAGDFNATPWSPIYRELQTLGLRDQRPRLPVQNTWPAMPGSSLWGIAIDHTLVAGDAWIAQREVGPDLGSDHLPVRSRIVIGHGLPR